MRKSQTIKNWKKRGVISTDYNKLYENYINNKNCEICKCEYSDFNKKCLDHSHITGEFKNYICNSCNVKRETPIQVNNKIGHQYICVHKDFRKKQNKYYISFQYQRIVNFKSIHKKSISLIKMLAFSFIQELKILKLTSQELNNVHI